MIAKLIVAGALLSSQAALAQQPSCLSRDQTADMVIVLMPHFIEKASQHCAPHLSARAFLPNGGRMLAERLRSEAPARTASALDAFMQMAGDEAPEGIGEEELTAMMGGMVGSELVAGLDEQDCRNTDQILAAIAPLPPENIGRFAAALFAISGVGGDGDESPSICPA